MEFIEMLGKQLFHLVRSEEMDADTLKSMGVQAESLVRINRHGDLEVRNASSWDIIGGMIGDFEERVQKETGRDWA